MKWYAGAILVLCVALVFQLGLLAYAMYALLAMLTISRFLARAWTENLSATRESEPRHGGNRRYAGGQSSPCSTAACCPVPWVLAEDVLPKPAIVQWPPRVRVSGQPLS